jgi:hypothetical protein
MANEGIQKIITHAINDEPAQVQTSAYEVLQGKVAEYLDGRTKYIGRHMFKKNKPESEQGE